MSRIKKEILFLTAGMFMAGILTGCGSRELESRKFPLVLEVNAEDGTLIFGCAWAAVKGEEGNGEQREEEKEKKEELPDPENGSNENLEDGSTWINTAQITRVAADTLQEALDHIQSLQDKYVDYSQVKAVIWGKDLAKNEELENEVRDWLERTPQFARNILVFQGKTEDLSLETIQKHAQGQPGAYLENLYKNNPKFQKYTLFLKEFLYF